MDNRSPITDYVLICSGRSQAHVRGIAERIETDMKQAGFRCAAMEGLQEGSW
ncbi:MAG: ribosome silencing factor, partial [Gammaproteobacteria bacterium]|nr:ribosome silencing factor [Gammaproteobacteria bacterium]NIT63474.1 ribosome silencing factor [Gammaproteobacteria bacterium]NIV20406.1 ribosome silencing factor [Gammaproteobacteria bacterium]NIY32054.1 ribosome silencing factor [Gammaproteobacteria bacterium]